jgi:hypothetical protein
MYRHICLCAVGLGFFITINGTRAVLLQSEAFFLFFFVSYPQNGCKGKKK